MKVRKSRLMEELAKFWEAVLVELPLAAGMELIGQADENNLRDAGWKAYDAWVRVSNEATNQIYSNPAVGEVSARLTETALRTQQAGSAVASAFFGNLWPAIGLPTAAEIQALRTEVSALRDEIRLSEAGRQDRSPARRNAAQSPSAADEGLHLIWSRIDINAAEPGKDGEVEKHAAA